MRDSLIALVVVTGLAHVACRALGEEPALVVPAGQFSRGDVTEASDVYGSYVVVQSVVEYELEVDGIAQLALEGKVAGDASLASYVDGKLHAGEAFPTSRTSLGLNEVPRWVAVERPIDVPAGAKRLRVVLRHDVRGGHRCSPRRVYELRFATRRGRAAAKLASAARKKWDYYGWLLERYPLSDQIQESPYLRPREPFRFDPALPAHPTDYPDAITSEEVGYQSGNALLRHGEVQRSRLEPALGRFVFGPAPTPEAEDEKITEYSYLAGEVGRIEVRAADGKPIPLRGAGLRFWPSHLQTRFEGPGVRVEVDSAVDYSDLLEARITLAADKAAALSITGSFNLPGRWWEESGLWLGQTVFYYLLGLDASATVPLQITGCERPIGYRIELAPAVKSELVMRWKPGYQAQAIREALRAQRTSPVSVAERCRQELRDFYARIVPPFACSDRRLEQIYYYVPYAVRLHVVDIPFEPYMHPYLTCSKIAFGGLMLWPENVASDAIYLRWLNDRSLGQRAILKGLERPDSKPLRPVTPPPKDPVLNMDRAALTVWEFAKCCEDQAFVDRIRKIIRTMADSPPPHPFEDGALGAQDGMLPQYDFSLRYKPFTQGQVYSGSQMNQPLAHIDANVWRYQVLCLAAAHARAQGDPAAAAMEARAEKIREAINRLMWDPQRGFYFDYATRDRVRSDVMSVAAFSALWAGVADRAQADRLVAHLTDPREFWPRFVVPATSLADPRTNPRGYTDGGILLDVNNWFPFQGLLHMGYRDVAVELFWRTVDLMSARGILSWGCYNFTADDGTPFSDRLTPEAGVGVDMILRCGTGFLPRTDDLLEFDPLILGPKLAHLDWGPYRYKKHWIEVHWRAAGGDPQYPAGFTVQVDGARFHRAQPRHILLRLESGRLQPVEPVNPSTQN